jgi:hypothetical protein
MPKGWAKIFDDSLKKTGQKSITSGLLRPQINCHMSVVAAAFKRFREKRWKIFHTKIKHMVVDERKCVNSLNLILTSSSNT